MLQIHSTVKLDDLEAVVRAAAQRHNATVTVVSQLCQPHQEGTRSPARDAFVFTLYHSRLYAELLAADIRFAGFLPCRVAAWPDADGSMLQAMTPSKYCEVLGRPDLLAQTAPLDDVLRGILDAASRPLTVSARVRPDAGEHHWGATEDQVNMRAALPQRIDYRGTKIEDEAGTGTHDAPGG
ncbi:MAG TPA: hypothetical protein VKR61_16030 [Bryobacteraceae bacterium]|nr:hypothetical protein [Bryobacteraceae bacterium]